jgi:hypothetical protein
LLASRPLAKKSRTPPPPRRVQAPRARTEPDLQRRRLILYALAGSGVLMLAVVLIGLSLVDRGGGSSASDPGPAIREAGCTLRSVRAQGASHTNDLNAEIDYNSFPPTSGTHYFQPAPFAFYEEPLSQVQVVHNLEHGGVAIQYGPDTPASTRAEIEAFYREDPRGLIVGPLPALEDKIALTAWTVEEGATGRGNGRLATCPRFSEEAFRAFLEAYRFKGPERFLPEDLEPGE